MKLHALCPEIDEFWSSSCSHGGLGARTASEHLRRWFSHRSSHANNYHSRTEGNAPWKETWRSKWAQNPQSRSPGWWSIGTLWFPDTRGCRAVGCWIWSDCCLLQKGSWSCNTRGNLCRGLRPGEHPCFSGENFCQSLPKLPTVGQGGNPWVCDSHWGKCLWVVHFLG